MITRKEKYLVYPHFEGKGNWLRELLPLGEARTKTEALRAARTAGYEPRGKVELVRGMGGERWWIVPVHPPDER